MPCAWYISLKHYLHEVKHVYLVHHIHELDNMNEIEETINFLKNFVTLFTFCELYDVKKKMAKASAKQFPHHNIT